VVLDLRGNPGGLLNEAVNIANLFVDRGSDIVSTRGKLQEWNKTYKAINLAEDDSLPLVILVNSSSASASEIVAGSLQDLDRAVLLGQRPSEKASCKPRVCSATMPRSRSPHPPLHPSGRCIQAINYARRGADGSAEKFRIHCAKHSPHITAARYLMAAACCSILPPCRPMLWRRCSTAQPEPGL
jgi:carboxyl-terminal processing protease